MGILPRKGRGRRHATACGAIGPRILDLGNRDDQPSTGIQSDDKKDGADVVRYPTTGLLLNQQESGLLGQFQGLVIDRLSTGVAL